MTVELKSGEGHHNQRKGLSRVKGPDVLSWEKPSGSFCSNRKEQIFAALECEAANFLEATFVFQTFEGVVGFWQLAGSGWIVGGKHSLWLKWATKNMAISISIHVAQTTKNMAISPDILLP